VLNYLSTTPSSRMNAYEWVEPRAGLDDMEK
jgi:hypothetical protein